MSFAARTYLDFERPLAELDSKIDDLMSMQDKDDGVDVNKEIAQLRDKSDAQLASIYKGLGPWEKTQVARHPLRPHFSQYAQRLLTDYVPLSGDRKFGDDDALLGGTANSIRFGIAPFVFHGLIRTSHRFQLLVSGE